MDAQLKAKWIEALRSGEYKQTHGSLRGNEGYCCLGVLCEIAGLSVEDDGTYTSYKPIYDLVGGREESTRLSMRNDGLSHEGLAIERKWTFPADYIERVL